MHCGLISALVVLESPLLFGPSQRIAEGDTEGDTEGALGGTAWRFRTVVLLHNDLSGSSALLFVFLAL